MDKELSSMVVAIFGVLVCLIDDLADNGSLDDQDRDWYFSKLSLKVGFDINEHLQGVKDARQRN